MKAFVSATSFLKPQNAAAKLRLEELFDEVTYNDSGAPLHGSTILKHLEGCDAYIAGLDYITADVIENMPQSVKVISRYGVGVDRVDVAAAEKRGIVVTNTPGANSTAVCELAFGLMLSVARNIPALHTATQKGEWPRYDGIELREKKLGIVGMGEIGKRLAVRARAFEMSVVAYDPFFDEAFATAHNIQQVSLDKLFSCCDVISLHVPLTEETHHMINDESIAKMKSGVIIINTARGGLIDEKAAVMALETGKIRGLGLDAFDQEPLTDSLLKGNPRVITTPHTGAHTNEAIARMGMMAVENAAAVLNGTLCRYVVHSRR